MNKSGVRLGVIGGSGVYGIEGVKDMKSHRISTPFGDPSDDILTGSLEGNEVAFLPRHGRGHRLIPSGINYRANIWALKKLGAEMIISVSAVGSMRENLRPGDVVLVDQFFDRTKNRESTFFGNGLVGHVAFGQPVCGTLADALKRACAENGVNFHDKGTYVCIEGPQFSTFAESCVYRGWGVDVIGMTALPEAKLAREAEICYSLMALVTDYDCWHPAHEAVTVDSVVGQMKKNVINAKKVLRSAIPAICRSDALRDCLCRNALGCAIQTSAEAYDRSYIEKLDLIVGKYLNENR